MASPSRPPRVCSLRLVLGVVLFVALMAAGGRIEAPMHPVPMSLQSLAVLGAGAFLGPRAGAAAVALYLLAGGAGLPVLAGGASGWARFAGPTAGYLFAFPLAAVLVGWAARRGWMERPGLALATGLAGHAVLLGLGAAWLAATFGPDVAWSDGTAPFLLGALVKSAVLAALTVGLARWRRRRRLVS